MKGTEIEMASTGFWISYLQNGIARKLGRNTDMDRRTCKLETLYPERHYDHKPALYLPGELDKIKAAGFGQPIERMIKIVKGKGLYSNTLARLEVKNAYLTPKYAFSGALRRTFYHKAPSSLMQDFETRDHGTLVSSHVGCNFFGHWLRDDCATYPLAAREAGGTPLVMPIPSWAEQPDYARRFGQDWTPTRPAFFRTLSLYVDHGQNPHKAERFHALRQSLRTHARAEGKTPGGAGMVYLKRGPQSTARTLTNEAEVIALLEKRGCHIHEAESGISQLETAGLDARIMIGVEGSQLSHALYTMRDRGGLLVLQPHDRFFTSHLDWCREMDMEFAFMVGTPDQGGFSMDLEVLARTLEMLDKAVP
ncbi:glycosyltransferase 61 family protein [Roseobacter weihaiensis]|uniref:glycosyltransferase 61 family protein n=1 Tax=Roseobacter weihaiensis TaxID=2763262 RepID=UPI001D0BA821|nr:glycosyltransferase 61 family protein [Roseobacter sp. H9]